MLCDKISWCKEKKIKGIKTKIRQKQIWRWRFKQLKPVFSLCVWQMKIKDDSSHSQTKWKKKYTYRRAKIIYLLCKFFVVVTLNTIKIDYILNVS